MADEATEQISFLFTGDTTDLDSAYERAEAGSDNLAATVVANFDEAEQAAAQAAAAISKFSESEEDAEEESGKLGRGLDQTQRKFIEITGSLGGTVSGLKDFGTSLHSLEGGLAKVGGAFHKLSPEFAEVAGIGSEAIGQLTGATGLLSAATTALSNPIGIAVVALLTYTAAITGVVFALKELAEAASEEGNQLFLMSQKTGISVENLGALEVGAELAGTSLQRIVLAITMLQSRMEKSNNSTSSAGKALRDLHLDTQDANVALMQLFEHLSKIPDPARRTQEAIKLMGFRMGRDFGQVVTEMGGSVEEFDKMLAARHITLGTEEAKGAHEFTREMVLLEAQWANLKRQIEVTAVPIVKEWLQDISKWLAKNHEEIVQWGHSFVEAIASIVPKVESVINIVKDLIGVFHILKQISPLNIEISIIKRIIESTSGPSQGDMQNARDYRTGGSQRYRFNQGQWEIAPPSIDTSKLIGGAGGSYTPPYKPSGGGGGGGGGADQAAQHALKMEQERLKQILAGYQHEQNLWDDMLRHKGISTETFTKAAINLETARSEATMKGLQKEYDAAAKLKKPAMDEKRLEIAGQMANELFRLDKVTKDRLFAADTEYYNRVKAQAEGDLSLQESLSKREEDLIRDNLSHRVINEEQATRRIIAIRLKLADDSIGILESALGQETKGESGYIAAEARLKKAREERTSTDIAGDRSIIESQKEVLESRIRFAVAMRSLDQEILGSQINTARVLLEQKIGIGGLGDPNDQRNARASLDRFEETERAKNRILDLNERLRVELIDKHGSEIESINARYRALREQAEEASTANLIAIDNRRLVELHAALGQLSATWATNISDSIAEGFEKGVGAGVKSFGRGILEMIHGVAMRELQKQLLAIFDNLAGRGGIIGKLFEIITGVKNGKGGTDAVRGLGTIAGTSADVAAKESAVALAKVTSSITVAGAQQTQELILAGATRTREITATIQAGIEHLCACNKPVQQGLLSTLLQAAIGGAISGAGGGVGGGGNNESGGTYAGTGMDTGTPQLVPFVPQPGYYEGGNFGENESFMVGEKGPEKVYTNERGGFVVPMRESSKSSEGAKQINITLNAPVLGSSSHSAPRSRREYLEMLAPALRDALNA